MRMIRFGRANWVRADDMIAILKEIEAAPSTDEFTRDNCARLAIHLSSVKSHRRRERTS